MTKPVLFLDIDGVIMPGSAWREETEEERAIRKERDGYLFPSTIMSRLNTLVAQTGAQVCVSSTWRHDSRFRERFVDAGFEGAFHEDWRTDIDLNMTDGGLYINQARGDEIAAWLARHPEVTRWAIVDDDRDMLPEQFDRFVWTSFDIGLTEAAADKLKILLQRQAGAISCS